MSGEIYSKEGKVKADSRVVFSQVDIKARKGGFFSVSAWKRGYFSNIEKLVVEITQGWSMFNLFNPTFGYLVDDRRSGQWDV